MPWWLLLTRHFARNLHHGICSLREDVFGRYKLADSQAFWHRFTFSSFYPFHSAWDEAHKSQSHPSCFKTSSFYLYINLSICLCFYLSICLYPCPFFLYYSVAVFWIFSLFSILPIVRFFLLFLVYISEFLFTKYPIIML